MSEPTPIDLPVGLRWIKLVYRLGQLVTDSTVDADPHPDLLPTGGSLTLTATPDVVRIQEADGRWRSVDIAGRTYTIRSDGELVDGEGRVGVWIPDPASLLVEPQGYAITAVVKPTTGKERRVTIGGSTALPDVVDLVAVSSVGSVSPSVTSSFDARLYALEQGGVDVSQVVEDYLTANPPAAVADATSTTKGVLQLAGDLGGTADAPTVPGLADKADAGHGHAISDVSGLQTALDDKQPAGNYAPATHEHAAAQISDSTATGRSVLTAADAAAARTAIGAGTSNLTIGTTASTAKAGNYTPPAATTTAQGVVELATTAEATTGTDTTRAVTPAGVAAAIAGVGGGVTDHGALNGLGDDDHPQYALADGTRGAFADPLGADDNYVTDAEKAALHTHPAVIAQGATAAAARTAIGAGTSNFTGAYADLTGKPTIPAAPGDIGAAPAVHEHTAADIDSGAAVDGHVLTADGAGGAVWEAPPAGGGGGGSDPWTYAVLGADWTCPDTNTYTNIPGLSIPSGLTAGVYEIRAAALSKGSATHHWSLSKPSGGSLYTAFKAARGSTETRLAHATAAGSSGGVIEVDNHPNTAWGVLALELTATLVVAASTSTAVELMLRSASGQTHTAMAGSWIAWRKIA